MIVVLAATLLLAVATGTVMTRVIVRDPHPRAIAIALALGAGLGLGLTACLFFVWLTIFGSRGFAALLACEVLVLAGLAVVWRVTRLVPGPSVSASYAGRAPLGWAWRLTLAVSVTASAALFLARLASAPHGGWDAWMTWNRAARFLVRGGADWPAAFSPIFRHPDYPLLVPGAVARAWSYMGTESVLAPAAVAAVFTSAVVTLTASALARLRTDRQAVLAALVLLATPSLLTYGASQYADIPLAFFVLATIVLLSLHDRLGHHPGTMLLAGCAAGLAAWTKNEGMLFVPAIVLARGVVVSAYRGWRSYAGELRWFMAGAAPALLIVVYFKLHFAPTNDLMADQGLAQTLPRLVDAARYVAVARAFKGEIAGLAYNGLVGAVPLVIGYLLCVGVKVHEDDRPALVTTGGALALMLAGYVVVLVSAPGDFLRLLNRSVDRLLLHVWPAIVFAAFMLARAPEERPE